MCSHHRKVYLSSHFWRFLSVLNWLQVTWTMAEWTRKRHLVILWKKQRQEQREERQKGPLLAAMRTSWTEPLMNIKSPLSDHLQKPNFWKQKTFVFKGLHLELCWAGLPALHNLCLCIHLCICLFRDRVWQISSS